MKIGLTEARIQVRREVKKLIKRSLSLKVNLIYCIFYDLCNKCDFNKEKQQECSGVERITQCNCLREIPFLIFSSARYMCGRRLN